MQVLSRNMQDKKRGNLAFPNWLSPFQQAALEQTCMVGLPQSQLWMLPTLQAAFAADSAISLWFVLLILETTFCRKIGLGRMRFGPPSSSPSPLSLATACEFPIVSSCMMWLNWELIRNLKPFLSLPALQEGDSRLKCNKAYLLKWCNLAFIPSSKTWFSFYKFLTSGAPSDRERGLEYVPVPFSPTMWLVFSCAL